MYGARWNGSRVQVRLVACFRALPGVPVWSPTVNALHPMKPGLIDGLALVEATQICLGRRAPECIALLTLCRMRARGQNVLQYCRDIRSSRATLYRQAAKGAKKVALYLNKRCV